MRHWAFLLGGFGAVGFLLADYGLGRGYAQGVGAGPWLNAPNAAQTGTPADGWRAKRPVGGAIAAQATLSGPWPAAAQSGAARASTPSGPSASVKGSSESLASPPPGFWSPAKVAGPVRVAQQPAGPVPPTAVPEPSVPGSAQPGPGPSPEAPALLPGGSGTRPVHPPQPGGPEVIPPGQPSPILHAPEPTPIPYPSEEGAEGNYWAGCEDGSCEMPCFYPWWGPGAYWGYPLFYGLFRDLTLFGGAHAFKGPVDGGINANFGLHEGVNYSGPLGDPWGGGFQIGFQAVHSNFRGYARRIYDGTLAGAPVSEPPLDVPANGAWAQHSFIVTNGDRDQLFFTAGLFRRAPMGGLQWGVVFDLMHDAYYYTADLKQVRAELSLVWPGCREIGFWGAFGVGNERVTDQFTYRRQDTQQEATYRLDFTLEPTDQFNFFYRQYFCNGGEGRLWIGFTGNTDVLFGGDLWIPLSEHFALENSFNILFPKETGEATHREHAWSVMIQLVWYPGRSARASQCNLFRPLFGVADNTSFMLDRKANPIP